MRSQLADKERINHILENIDVIFSCIGGLSEEMFYELKIEKLGVVKAIENIGEAANHLTEETKSLTPEIDWIDIIGMRNKLVHEYFQINYRIVFEVATIEIPKLHQAILKIIEVLKTK
ncbi:HepT-like ribonuclease domain-containing protein [Flavobacterium filum]|uniref:HepT-like ribonuclease domain-containing protein n=1 Tax=Flavobacterium filum TaxID=370974 RepID=UPI0023F59239|nr:HepT-like ribonuclease domain-containing protein [Flavobacterium filum]